MNILIAEDNEDARILHKTILESEGYKVKSAVNGAEALDIARELNPDMIISDIMMPEMDGFELCRTVKTDEELKGIPFVFYTATYTESSDEELALSVGGARFIIKPENIPSNIPIVNQNTLSL